MEKVGKMVFKMKPSKSGINKLPLFRQFRPACKNWGSSDETFCRTWKFPAKRYMYNFYSTFAREGPLPLPNCFFCYTRPPSRSGLRPTRPPWLILLPKNIICFTFTPSQVSYCWKKSYLKRSHSLCPLRAQWWSRFFSSHWTSSPNSSHKTLLWFYLKFAVSSCDSDFFHVTGVPTTGPHEIPIQILSQFWKYWFDFFAVFRKIN